MTQRITALSHLKRLQVLFRTLFVAIQLIRNSNTTLSINLNFSRDSFQHGDNDIHFVRLEFMRNYLLWVVTHFCYRQTEPSEYVSVSLWPKGAMGKQHLTNHSE